MMASTEKNKLGIRDPQVFVRMHEGNSWDSIPKISEFTDISERGYFPVGNIRVGRMTNRDEYKLFLDPFSSDYDELLKDGCCYIMTITDPQGFERILKIGQTSNHFYKGKSNRLGSYNTGTKTANADGTCSTTNFGVLQSFGTYSDYCKNLGIGSLFRLWAYVEPTLFKDILLYSNCINYPAKKQSAAAYKHIEGEVIKRYVAQFGRKPLFCIQE